MSSELSNIEKISGTQKVIRKKFVKAYANRTDHENEVNRSIKPLTCIRTTVKKPNKNSLLKVNSINELCNRLQKHINSQISTNDNYSQEISTIISKLRELKIIV